MSENTRFYIRTSLTLLLISACVALLLAAVNAVTAKRIAENESAKTESAIRELFPDALSYQSIDTDISLPLTDVREVKNSVGVSGYCAFGSVQGFKSEINFIVGMDMSGSIVGVRVISNSETAGLGSKISGADYLSAYNGKSGELTLKDDVDAIAGATISSRALLEGINAALALPLFGDNAAQTETAAVESTETAGLTETTELTESTTATETIAETTVGEAQG